MMPAELQQAVVFAARFEFYAQTFRFHDGTKLAGVEASKRDDFDKWKPVKDGDRVLTYCREVLPPLWTTKQVEQYARLKAWCGLFALWCIKQAGLAPGVFWRDGLGFCEVEHLTRVTMPEPGDVAYFDKPFQHHAIVERADALTFDSIDGNQPAILRHQARKLSSATHFYSIGKFIAAALASGVGE